MREKERQQKDTTKVTHLHLAASKVAWGSPHPDFRSLLDPQNTRSLFTVSTAAARDVPSSSPSTSTSGAAGKSTSLYGNRLLQQL